MRLPEHLLLMKSKVLQGIAPQAVLDDYVNIEAVEQRQRPAAMAYASAFVDALERTPGAPRGDLWAKQKDASPRVYLPGGFVSFSPQGEISGDRIHPGLRRQRLSWSKDSLYPSQRKPYDKAVALYLAERRAIAEDMLEALQARISVIHDALDAAVSVDDEDFDEDELDARAERAAWQERHEAGRRNPSPPLRRVSPGRYVTQDGMWEISRVTEGVDEGWWRWESSLASDQITEHLSIEHVDADPVPTKADATYELFYCLAHAEEYPSIARRLANLAKVRPHKNPSPLPEGFTTRFGGGVSDDYVAPPLPMSRRVLRDVQRGDVVTVGRTKWAIIRSLGDVQVSAYKYPSKRAKRYEIQAGAHGEDYVVVFEVGGSGQRISEDVATGPLRETNEKVEMF